MSDTKLQIPEAQSTKQDKCQTKLYLDISFSNFTKSKMKALKEARGIKHLTYT